jgi:predicted CopG family antitoxin
MVKTLCRFRREEYEAILEQAKRERISFSEMCRRVIRNHYQLGEFYGTRKF